MVRFTVEFFVLYDTGGPPLTLFSGTAEKTVIEEDFLSTIDCKNGSAEFLRKNRVKEKSALEEDRVIGGPPVQHTYLYTDLYFELNQIYDTVF